MISTILLVVIAFGVWWIYYSYRNGHKEIIKGLESIDNRLEQLQNKE